MPATLLPNGKQQFEDINGNPLVAGTVGMYVPTTLTPKTTWQDADQSILNTNPIILDSRGQAIIYGSGVYRQIVKDSLGNVIWDQLTASTGASDLNYDTVTAATAATISTSQDFILIAGYAAIGDACEVLMYKRVSAQPSAHQLWFQSADLAYWEYQPGSDGVNAAVAGMLPTNADNVSAWGKLQTFVQQLPSNVTYSDGAFMDINVPKTGVYVFASSITWDVSVGGIRGNGSWFVFTNTGAHGITVDATNPGDGSPYRNYRTTCDQLLILGPSSGTNYGLNIAPVTSAASHFGFRRCSIIGWKHGIDFNSNAYLISFEDCGVFFNETGITDGNAGANSGENIRFVNTDVFNNTAAGVIFVNPNADYSMTNASIDYNGGSSAGPQISVLGSTLTLEGGHVEGGAPAAYQVGKGATLADGTLTTIGTTFIQVSSGGSVPYMEILDGGYVSHHGGKAILGDAGTTTAVKAYAGATLTRHGFKINGSGAITTDTGSTYGNYAGSVI